MPCCLIQMTDTNVRTWALTGVAGLSELCTAQCRTYVYGRAMKTPGGNFILLIISHFHTTNSKKQDIYSIQRV